jgi:hypothetical protein
VWGLVSATALAGGCSGAMGRYMAYLWHGGNQREVEAEFEGLEGKSLAVVIYADQRTQYEYPDVNRTLSAMISGLIEKNVDGVTVVSPTRIARYQDENIYWLDMDKPELGKALGADYVLFVPLEEFGTRLPDSSYLYRGRVTCQPSLYDTSKPPREARVHKFEKIRVRYPEHEPAGMLTENDRQVRVHTEELFAQKLAWKFYDHDEEIKP